jgi:hypothetical protein
MRRAEGLATIGAAFDYGAATTFTRPAVRPRGLGLMTVSTSRSAGTGSVNVRLNRMSAGQSRCMLSPAIPLPRMRRCQSTSSAIPTRTFFGSHPRSAQVPPNGRLSTMATVRPASRRLYAAAAPASPVPMTTRSNACAVRSASRCVVADRHRGISHQDSAAGAPTRPSAKQTGPAASPARRRRDPESSIDRFGRRTRSARSPCPAHR